MNRIHATLALAPLAALSLCAPTAAHAQSYTLQALATFSGANGANPYADLTLVGSTLYGTTVYGGTNNDGTVFSVPITGGAPATLVNFDGASGANPYGGLTLVGSALYGTTANGGANGDGTVFSVPLTGGVPTTLATFSGDKGGNGSLPYAGLTLSADGSTLYGTTTLGGSENDGTVFSLPIAGGPIITLANFNVTNGERPLAGLTLVGSTLYGTTSEGGAHSGGIVFSVPITGGAPTTLVNFDGTNGDKPYAGLTHSADGSTLYGTTSEGGASGVGTVFSLDPSTGALTTLVSFDYTNGYRPYAGLTLSADGKTLYGTTHGAGASNDGLVFSLDPTTGGLTTLASFDNTNGANPYAGLTLSADGKTLYGAAFGGGDPAINGGYPDGTVFSLTPNPGSSQSNPILPTSTTTANGVTTFAFAAVPTGSWVDPKSATAFAFAMTGGSLFTEIGGFPTGFASPFDVTADGKDYGLFAPGQTLTFDGGGVSSFLISGINPAVDGSDPTAFPLQVAFNTATADFTMVAGAPEPSPFAALAIDVLGICALGLRVRKRSACLGA